MHSIQYPKWYFSNYRKKAAAGAKPAASQDKVKFSTLINSLEPPQIGKVVEMIQTRCSDALNEVYP